MCELCGCGVVGAKARLANADRVPPVLAAIRVKVVEPGARGAHPARPRQKRRPGSAFGPGPSASVAGVRRDRERVDRR